MIGSQQVEQIASDVARTRLGTDLVARVLSGPTANSTGQDALSITIVIEPGAVEKLEGEALLDTLVNIQQQLQAAGEERLAILDYATEKELHEDGDPQS